MMSQKDRISAFGRLAGGVIFAAMILGAAACSKSDEEESAATGGGAGAQTAEIGDAAEEVPEDALIVDDITIGVKGGTLLMAIAGDPKTFNEPLSTDVPSTTLAGFLFEGLVGIDYDTQKDVPALAKSWDYNEETREWTFHIRKNLQWSDGHPLTADDFLFYTEIIRDESVPSTSAQYMESDGKPFEFSAPDPYTFVAKIPVVDSFAFLNLGLVRAFPRHKYETALKEGRFAEILGTDTAPEDVVGSGPYKLKEFRSGEKVVLEANPYYYQFDTKGQRLPYVQELILLNVPDYDAMALRFQAGDLDFLDDGIPAQNITVLQDGQEEGDYTVYNPGLALSNNHYWFNLKPGGSYEDEEGDRVQWDPPTPGADPPAEIASRQFRYYVDPIKRKWFENEEFRKACSMATNRDAIVRTILFGEGAPIYGFTVPSNELWHNPNIPKYPYDLAKADKKLIEIGFIDRDGDGIREDPDGNPIRFTIITNKENNIREKVGVLLKEDMTKIGFDVTLQLLDFNNIVTRLHDTYDYEACILGLASGVPPHPAMSRNIWLSSSRMHTFHPNQKTPATEWEARIDELYLSLSKFFQYEEQKKITDEMEYIWAEHQGVIHLMQPQLYVAAKNKIGNLKPSTLRPHISHNLPELYIKPR